MLPAPRAAILAGLVVVAASTLMLLHRATWAPPAGFGPAPAPAGAAASAAPAPTTNPTLAAVPRSGDHTRRPVQVSIPSLGIDARVVPVLVSASGELAVPEDVRVVGWWQPQNASGTPTLVVGHVDSARLGRGAFFPLRHARPGALVELRVEGMVRRYRVYAMHVYDKRAFPAWLLAPSAEPPLLLVTCGGPFDTRTHHYRDNVVVFARPMGTSDGLT